MRTAWWRPDTSSGRTSVAPAHALRPQPALVGAHEAADVAQRLAAAPTAGGSRAPRAASGTRRSSAGRTRPAGSRASGARARPGGTPSRSRPRSARGRAAGPPRTAPRGTGPAPTPSARPRRSRRRRTCSWPGKRAVRREPLRRARRAAARRSRARRRPRSRSGAPSRDLIMWLASGRALVRAEHGRDVVGLLEALEQRRQPAVVGGRRVLGEERHVVAARQRHHPVARAAVRELALVDLVDDARRGGAAISSEPSVEPESTIRISSSRSTRWARTALSTSSR